VAVLLDPDVARVFQSAESVNAVLRALVATMPSRRTPTERRSNQAPAERVFGFKPPRGARPSRTEQSATISACPLFPERTTGQQERTEQGLLLRTAPVVRNLPFVKRGVAVTSLGSCLGPGTLPQ